MKLYKYLFLAVAAVGFFASCSEEGYWEPYDTQSTPTYSFSKTSNNYSLTGEDKLPELTVTVHRSTNVGEVSIPLNLNANSDIITVDPFVTFSDGEFYKNVTINVDEEKMKAGVSYKAELSFLVDEENFNESNQTISGNRSYTVTFKKEYVFKPIGKVLYTDDLPSTFFGIENLTYEVEAEVAMNNGKVAVVRLIDPYCAAYPYNEEGDYDTTSRHIMEINCEDPEGVYMDGIHYSGMNWGYGEFRFQSLAYYYMQKGASLEDVKAEGYCGRIVDNVITFPAKTMLCSMADYNSGGFYTSNPNGQFKIDLNPAFAE